MKLRPIAVAFSTAVFSVAAFAGGAAHTQSQMDEGAKQPQAAEQSSAGSSQKAQGDEQVKKAQEKLSQQGQNPGAADGVLGPKTQAALKDFQKQNNLEPSGKLDSQTIAALKLDESGASSSSTGSSASPSKDSSGAAASGSSESSKDSSMSSTTDKSAPATATPDASAPSTSAPAANQPAPSGSTSTK